MRTHKLISTVFGVGYVSRGGGTLAALICCVCWYIFSIDGYSLATFGAIAIIFAVGVWSANVVERDWGKDSNRVVIDEVAGMAISLLFVPLSVKYILVAFALFRFFDIVKPLYIRKTEQLPGGWGVMIDDVLAGVYTNIVMQGILFLKLF